MTDNEKKFVIALYRCRGCCRGFNVKKYLYNGDAINSHASCPVQLHCSFTFPGDPDSNMNLRCTREKAFKKAVELIKDHEEDFVEVLL